MGTKKGLFTKEDADRYTQKHLEICKWFLSNSNLFVRCFLYDKPVQEVRVTLEHLITAQNGFIIGFADVLLSYSTDHGDAHTVLIEVKTSLRDEAEALRQLNTYPNYLSGITKRCLVHGDSHFKAWWNEDDEGKLEADLKMRDTFSSQGIYVADYESLQHGFFIPDYICVFPSGRREVMVDCISEEENRADFQLCGVGIDRHGHECETAAYLILHSPFPTDLWKLLGMRNAESPFKQVRKVPCLIDVEHHAGGCGFAEEKYSAIHSRDMSVTVDLKEKPKRLR